MTLTETKPAKPSLNFNAPAFSPNAPEFKPGQGLTSKNVDDSSNKTSSTEQDGKKYTSEDQGQQEGVKIKSKLNPDASSFQKPTTFDKLVSTIAAGTPRMSSSNMQRIEEVTYAQGYKQFSQNNSSVKSRAARQTTNNNSQRNSSNNSDIIEVTNTNNNNNNNNANKNKNGKKSENIQQRQQKSGQQQQQNQQQKQQQLQTRRKGGIRDQNYSNKLETGQVLEIPAQPKRAEKVRGAAAKKQSKKQTQKNNNNKQNSTSTATNSNKENQVDKNINNKNSEVDQDKKLTTQTSAIDADMLQQVLTNIDETVGKTKNNSSEDAKQELSEKVDSSNSVKYQKHGSKNNDSVSQGTSKKQETVAVRLDDDSSVGGKSGRKTRRGTRAGRRVKTTTPQNNSEENSNVNVSPVSQAQIEGYERRLEKLEKEKTNAEDMADQMMNQMYTMMQEKQKISTEFAKLERDHNNVLEQVFYLEHLLHGMDVQNHERDSLILDMVQLQRLIDVQLSQKFQILPQSMSVQNLSESQQETNNVGVTESSIQSYDYDYQYHDHYDDEDDEDDGDMAYINQRKHIDPTKEIEPQSFSDYEGDHLMQGVNDPIEEGTCEGSELY